jgi:hypothetical protein
MSLSSARVLGNQLAHLRHPLVIRLTAPRLSFPRLEILGPRAQRRFPRREYSIHLRHNNVLDRLLRTLDPRAKFAANFL